MKDLAEWTEAILGDVQQTLRERSRRPEATYRLQFHPEHLTFHQAAEIVPYLADLGISHLYASPYLKTKSGSPHGYAVVDYGSLDPGLGSDEDFARLKEALQTWGLAQLLDIVPNHMAVAPGENRWWDDVLENGPSSPFAEIFDIDWRPVTEELRNRILLPMLGGQFGQVLESGELQLHASRGVFFLSYYESTLPLDPSTFPVPLGEVLTELKSSLPEDSEDLRELESILTALDYLPHRNERAPERVEERQREKEVIKSRLRRLSEGCPPFEQAVQAVLQHFNGTPGESSSFDRLEGLLNAQVYRLSHWKAASDEINYRRFFDVNELAAISTELPQVFEATHRFVLELLADGTISGLRIDHIDGLFDPLEYLWRLQEGYLRALARRAYQRLASGTAKPAGSAAATSDTSAQTEYSWEQVEAALRQQLSIRSGNPAGDPASPQQLPLYVVVEKILGPEEPLPPDWPVAGTTGYDFLNLLNGLFVEPHGLDSLLKLYRRFTQEKIEFAEVAYETKQLILRVAMSSELQLLAHRLNRISETHRSSRDFTLNTLRYALREILACFPVYRTYANAQGVGDRDRRVIRLAVARAKRRNPARDAAAYDFVSGVLLFEQPADLDADGQREREFFVGRFQQVTSPVTAKGIEDTAFYRYYPLISLNEVGGEPAHALVSVDDFHHSNLARRRQWPQALTCTSTHDTKRSEDVRARINVLSEIPRLWRDTVNRWSRLNRRHHRDVEGQAAPSRNDEYLIYQTLIGVWPTEPLDEAGHQQLVTRMTAYLEKATHEAKRHTSWISPDPDYDVAVRDFVAAVLSPGPKNQFLPSFEAFHQRVLPWGLHTALAQAFLKLASPGVPDIYQGQELWDFSLVDPDNRRPVDYPLRRRLLEELQAAVAAGGEALRELARALAVWPSDPRLKLFVTWRTLQFRRQHPELFAAGRYLPLRAEGSRANHVCGLAWRSASGEDPAAPTAVFVAPRLLAGLMAPANGEAVPAPLGRAVWGDTQLVCDQPLAGRLTNLFTGQTCEPAGSRLVLAEVLADFPLALLTNSS